jgi:hypothetical protein
MESVSGSRLIRDRDISSPSTYHVYLVPNIAWKILPKVKKYGEKHAKQKYVEQNNTLVQ